MTNPICSKHGKPMSESKFGGFYCKVKEGDDWCGEKSDKSSGQDSPKAVGEVLATSGWVPAKGNNDVRVAAALNFAGRIYQGAGMGGDTLTADMERLALNLAERALLMFERKP